MWYNWDAGKSGSLGTGRGKLLQRIDKVNKGQIEMEQLSVNPSIIEVTDIDKLTEVGASVDVRPSYYNVILRISPLVIQKLLMWLLTNDYIKLDGTLTISIRGRSYKYVQ